MKTEKIKEAIKINAKLVELGIDINSKDWEIFNFKLDEWGNLIIKSGKLDHKPFVSAKPKKITRNNERLGEIWNEVMNEAMKKVYEPLGNSEQLELTFESVSILALKKGLLLSASINIETENVKYYEIYEKEDRTLLFICKTLQEIKNYLSELQ